VSCTSSWHVKTEVSKASVKVNDFCGFTGPAFETVIVRRSDETVTVPVLDVLPVGKNKKFEFDGIWTVAELMDEFPPAGEELNQETVNKPFAPRAVDILIV
jgi:hypothetical protein